MGLFNSKPELPLQWTMGRHSDGMNLSVDAQAFAGVVRTEGADACYVTLGPTPTKFGRLEQGEGIRVREREIHVVEVEIDADENAIWSVLLMQYDANGDRISTERWKTNGTHRFNPSSGAERILLALRVAGPVAVDVKKLGWSLQEGIVERCLARAPRTSPLMTPPVDGKVILLDQNRSSQPLTIWPGGSVRFCAFDLAPGRYELDLQHRVNTLDGRAEALAVHFAFDEPFAEGIDPRWIGLTQSSDGLGAAMPVESRRHGRLRNAVRFTVLEPQSWVVCEVVSSIDQFLNIESASLSRYAPPVAVEDSNLYGERVANFLSEIEDADNIEHVVYADISVNVVDGSSVWLSSLLSMLTASGRCLLVSKANVERDVILSNVQNRENLTVLSPIDIRIRKPFGIHAATTVIHRLDEQLPGLRNVIVRGCAVAESLFATRRFRDRGFAYLTDFYEYTEEGITFPEEKVGAVRTAAAHAGALLIQNAQVEAALKQLAGRDFRACLLPPAIPDIDLAAPVLEERSEGVVRIGYAGKINPRWGVIELLDWTETLVAEGHEIELHIASNKISETSGSVHMRGLRSELLARFDELGVHYHDDLNREQAMSLMNAMDFVWCWRPAELEENTLELSTKLVEMAALGARCICYPNAINRELLGANYPFYATGLDDVAQMLAKASPRRKVLADEIRSRFDLRRIGMHLTQECLNAPKDVGGPNILVAGNGLKFVEPYLSSLKARGYSVKVDPWEWGRPCDIDQSARHADWAETIFCEWGLANAVWHSNNLRPDQRLFVRCHAQEVREKARHFGFAINANNVERFIFVSERIRREAIDLFGWPEEKTVVIPNFLLEDEYRMVERDGNATVRLGLVGIVPSSKRFDRALDLVGALVRRGVDVELHLKGHRPEQHDYMFAPGRIAEMKYYFAQYDRMERDPDLKGRVFFDGWGNDVADWYGRVDYILSTSDHESFHYALADGVLTGCHPLLWPWSEADRIYPTDWIVSDVEAAADRVIALQGLDGLQRQAIQHANRDLLIERYGHQRMFALLDDLLGLD